MRILIAEDETIIRLDLRALLEKAGFDVCAEAKDGEEAVTLARTLEPDLALLDGHVHNHIVVAEHDKKFARIALDRMLTIT